MEHPGHHHGVSQPRAAAMEFEKNGRVVGNHAAVPLSTMNFRSAIARGDRGAGLSRLVRGMVEGAIEAGKLVRVMEDWCPYFPAPFLSTRARRQTPPALAAFIAFIKEWKAKERRRNWRK